MKRSVPRVVAVGALLVGMTVAESGARAATECGEAASLSGHRPTLREVFTAGRAALPAEVRWHWTGPVQDWFENLIHEPGGFAPASVAAADLDRDGRPDFVAVGRRDSSLLLFVNAAGRPRLQATLGLEHEPSAVALADLDGDGWHDAVVTFWYRNILSVYRGGPGPSFVRVADYPTGRMPVRVLADDVSGDALPDVVVSNHEDNTVSVFFGDGAGGLDQPKVHVVGLGPATVVARDFDADGLVDLATADAWCQTVSLLRGSGGSFSARVISEIGTRVEDLVPADLDGDGDLDLVANNAGQGLVLMNDGTGRFTRTQTIPHEVVTNYYEPTFVAAADFDHDGSTDMAFVEGGAPCAYCFVHYDRIGVALNDGRGLMKVVDHVRFVVAPSGLLAVDVDADGNVDLSASTFGSGYSSNDFGPPGGLSVLLGRGSGSFRGVREFSHVPPYVYPSESHYFSGVFPLRWHPAAPPLLVASRDDGLWSSRQEGSMLFAPLERVGPGKAHAVADLDGDGGEDVLASSGDSLGAWLSRGDGVFAFAGPLATGRFLAHADFTGDGRPDLATADSAGQVRIHPWEGHLAFGPAQPTGARVKEWLLASGAADLDGDGFADLVFMSLGPPWGEADSLSVALADGQGGLRPVERYPVEVDPSGQWQSRSRTNTLRFADLDRDGDADVVVLEDGGYSPGNLSVLLNDGAGRLTPIQDHNVWSDSYSMAISDFDLDGVTDVIVGEGHSDDTGHLHFFRGAGDGTLEDLGGESHGDAVMAMAADDLDADGDPDLVFVSWRGIWFTVLKNQRTDPPAGQAILAAVTAKPSQVTIRWRAARPSPLATRILRASGGRWRSLGSRRFDAAGTLELVDGDVTPSRRYGYRLVTEDAIGATVLSERWVDVPAAPPLTLAGVTPNPVRDRATVRLSLPAVAPAALELYDVAGRRVWGKDVGSMGPGVHELILRRSDLPASGLYWLRLSWRGEASTARAVFLP